MRTTITLDDDVAAKLEREVKRSGKPFKTVVNETLRLGLFAQTQTAKLEPFKVKTRDLGQIDPAMDFTKAELLFDQLDGPDRLR